MGRTKGTADFRGEKGKSQDASSDTTDKVIPEVLSRERKKGSRPKVALGEGKYVAWEWWDSSSGETKPAHKE